MRAGQSYIYTFIVITSFLLMHALKAEESKLIKIENIRNITTDLIKLSKSLQVTQDKQKKEKIKSDIIATAKSRHQMILASLKKDSSLLTTMAIPDEKKQNLPQETLKYLESSRQLRGEIKTYHVEMPEHEQSYYRYELKASNNETIELHFANKLEVDLSKVKDLKVEGLYLPKKDAQSNAHLILDTQQTQQMLLGAEENSYTSSGETLLASNNYVLGPQHILVMLVNFSDNPTNEPYPLSHFQTTYSTLNDFTIENSYGQTSIQADFMNWTTINVTSDSCPLNTIAFQAREAATEQGLDLSLYRSHVIIFPKNSSCGFSGLAQVGGSPGLAWINGQTSWSLHMHEIGHTFGLFHSNSLNCGNVAIGDNCIMSNYGDILDVMGSGSPGHFNAFQKDRLGWLQNRILTVSTSGQYKLSHFELIGPYPSAIKIAKDIDAQNGGQNWYYLESRQLQGFDAPLRFSNAAEGIVVHMGNELNGNSSNLLDMTPGSSNGMWDSALETGFTYTDSQAGISFTTKLIGNDYTEVNIDIDSSPTVTCTKGFVTSELSPSSQWASAGTGLFYNFTITNNDGSACEGRSFNLSYQTPSGWSGQLSQSSLFLNPGEVKTLTFSVTSSSSATDGFYSISATASGSTDSSTSNATYVIDNPTSNNAPFAGNDKVTTQYETAVSINVLANDSDPDGDALSVSSYTQAVHGTLLLVDNIFTYTPDTGFSGSDSFTYTINDGKGASASATVNINVEAVVTNQAPLAEFTFSCSDLTCSFQDTSSDSDGYIASRSFNFADGTSSTLASTTHTYASEGSYTVTLTVIDNDGARKSISKTVKVTAPVVTTSIKLSSTTSKHKGSNIVTLKWSGASGERVRILRDGSLLLTTANDGTHQDSFKGKANYTYQVCEEATQTCSAVIK